MEPIEKLDTDKDPGFNGPSIKRELREIKLKMNEIINYINLIIEPEYTKDYDENDEDEEGVYVDPEIFEDDRKSTYISRKNRK